MSHKTSLTVTFLALLTACGSSQNVPERTEQVPDAVQAVSPAPVATITVDQDANATVAPPPVQPSAPIVATPLPTVWPTPAPSETPAPIASATPVPTPTQSYTPPVAKCVPVDAYGKFNFNCGTWIVAADISQAANCPEVHAALHTFVESETEVISPYGTEVTWGDVLIDSTGNYWSAGFDVKNDGTGEYRSSGFNGGGGHRCALTVAPGN